MKTKTGKVILCAAALLLSMLSAGITGGLLGSSGLDSGMKFLYGLSSMWVPILIIVMIITMFKK